MKNTYGVQVRRGTITLPRDLRKGNKIEEGDTLTLVDLGGGAIAMMLINTHLDKLANTLAETWQNSGETLESLLEALRDVRDKNDKTAP